MRILIITTIKLYQIFISQALVILFGRACRQSPTCSQYAYYSIRDYGVYRGLKMSLIRFVRCNPYTS